MPHRAKNRAPENWARPRPSLAAILLAALALATTTGTNAAASPLTVGVPLAPIALSATSITYLPFVTPTVSGIRTPRVGRRLGLIASSLKLVPYPAAQIEVRCRGCPKRAPLTHGIRHLHAIHGEFIPNNATLIIILTARDKGGRYILRTHAGSSSPGTEELCLAPDSRRHPYKCEEPNLVTTTTTDVPGTLPMSLTPPQISGQAIAGETLACSPGSWTGTPTYDYQWTREHVPIAGADTATYKIPSADEGHTLYCEVTATNHAGSANAGSVGVTVAAIPINTSPPQITGVPALGEMLACSTGSWTGTPAPAFTYQWRREEVPIPGATQPTYRIEAADEGHQLTCQVTARNSSGARTATSQAVNIPSAPVNIGSPEITGTPAVGQKLGCSDGSWLGSSPISYILQWQRDGEAITGATSVQYTVQGVDEGHQLTCQVTAHNSAGQAAARSAAVAIPEASGGPTITSVDGTRGDLAPYQGAFDIANQRFTARSDTVTIVAAAIANPSLPPGPTSYPAQLRICTNEECTGPGAQLASVQADVQNYGLTRAELEATVTPGETYYLVWTPPTQHESNSWITFWHAGGAGIGESQEMEAAVRGYDKGSEGAHGEIISYLGTRAPPTPYSGPFKYAYQDFKAASNRINKLGVVVGNPRQARGATGSSTIKIRLCETPDCSGGILATSEPFIANYEVTEAQLSPAVKVTPGKTYFINWQTPTSVSGEPWVTFWLGTGPLLEESTSTQAFAKGYDAEGIKYTPHYLTEQVEGFGTPTFKDYLNASDEGSRIEAGASVEVSCRVYAPEIESTEPEGFWYRIHTTPWNDEFYAAANSFFNTSGGESHYTDTAVPEC